MGLIDTLSLGFRIVRRHPWLILWPLLLDIWLWLGPQLSVQPLVDGMLAAMPSAQLPADMAQVTESYQQLLADAAGSFNLMWLLSSNLTWLNALLPGLSQPAQLVQVTAPVAVGPLALLVLVPGLLVIGLGLGTSYLTATVAQVQKDGGVNSNQVSWPRRFFRTWGLTLVYGLVLLVVLLAVAAIVSLGLTAVLLVVPGLATALTALAVLLFGWAALWLYLILYFVVASLAMDGVNLRQALWLSSGVVMRNFWGTLGLVIVTFVILNGFGLIWQRLADLNPAGTVIAIVGNAILLCGLTAARLVFYWDRRTRWLESLQARA